LEGNEPIAGCEMTQTELKLSVADQLRYPDGFWPWLRDNPHIWQAFRVKAIRMALLGRKRYSARTIIETIRWDTDLKDSETTFKINDHYTPGLARLFMHDYGHKWPGFFNLRDSQGMDE